MSAIKFSQVSRSFTGRIGKVRALDCLSFSVSTGSIFGLAGINGAGKTTAIRALIGLTPPESGEILINNQSPADFSPQQLGFAPEIPDFPDHLNAREVIEYSCALLDCDIDNERIEKILADLELGDFSEQAARHLSKGNRQRLSLAAAIAHNPTLIVLDEPTSGLDPLGRKLIKKMMLQLKAEGKTLFFSTHILSDLREICDQIGIIHRGKMVFSGTPTEFCAEPGSAALEERFAGLVLSGVAT
jgi:ABC-2 type transport system ATP-binding protein